MTKRTPDKQAATRRAIREMEDEEAELDREMEEHMMGGDWHDWEDPRDDWYEDYLGEDRL